jgi:RNA polymerase sigma-70 factor (sigma-E family)
MTGLSTIYFTGVTQTAVTQTAVTQNVGRRFSGAEAARIPARSSWAGNGGGGGMAGEADGADLERLLAERGGQLMGAAIALTGSREEGEDLLQAALERVLRKPRQVDGDIEGYLRRVLYNLAADGWRRRGRWRQKLPLLRSQDIADAADGTAVVDLRDELLRLLLQLPPRQRAVVVLRYWEQLTEVETAALLGCSEGTVRSAASRGVRRLRELADSPTGADAELTEERS